MGYENDPTYKSMAFDVLEKYHEALRNDPSVLRHSVEPTPWGDPQIKVVVQSSIVSSDIIRVRELVTDSLVVFNIEPEKISKP